MSVRDEVEFHIGMAAARKAAAADKREPAESVTVEFANWQERERFEWLCLDNGDDEAERVVVIVERHRRDVIRSFLELQRKMALHAANGGDCPYEAKAVGAFAAQMRKLAISLSDDGWL